MKKKRKKNCHMHHVCPRPIFFWGLKYAFLKLNFFGFVLGLIKFYILFSSWFKIYGCICATSTIGGWCNFYPFGKRYLLLYKEIGILGKVVILGLDVSNYINRCAHSRRLKGYMFHVCIRYWDLHLYSITI